jgi:hypothetical protein
MKKLAVSLLILLLLTLASASSVLATTPTSASGTFQFKESSDAGDVFTTSGTLLGTLLVVPVSGVDARGYFTGSVNGVEGELVFNIVGPPVAGHLGYATILSGSGGLADLRGHITYDNATGTYQGEIHFEP